MLICTHCGTATDGRVRGAKGSGGVEATLWLTALVPGIVYSVWRRSGAPACPMCHRQSLVDLATPVGQQMAAQLAPGALVIRRRPKTRHASTTARDALWAVLALGVPIVALLVLIGLR